MLENYLIVHKSILPDYYETVLAVRRRLESGQGKDVSQACREAGISRSTYYKYKDYIFEPNDLTGSRKAVFSMMLAHGPGVLSGLLKCLSDLGASVLTITQSLPIHGMASLMLSIDLSQISRGIDEMTAELSAIAGVENVRLLALE